MLAGAAPNGLSMCRDACVEAVKRQPGQCGLQLTNLQDWHHSPVCETHLPCAAIGALRMLSWPPFS